MATSDSSMQTRIKSSFIYLANAVSDLRGNWLTLVLVLSPMVLLSALCVLPDALNVQHQLTRTFEPGVHSIGWWRAQMPYTPDTGPPPPPLFGRWTLRILHLMLAALAFLVKLVGLCTIKRIRSGKRQARMLNETIEVYREAIALTPSFLWIALIQVVAISVGFMLLVIPGLLAIVWLYLAPYALVFDNRRSWQALLYSRDLMRGRLWKVAVRILVFLAVWSGFNGWVGGAYLALALLVGVLAAWSGAVISLIFLLTLFGTAVAYTTTVFFMAAGARLYQDLQAIVVESAVAGQGASLPATAPLPNLTPATE
jgi:hypothetical protein